MCYVSDPKFRPFQQPWLTFLDIAIVNFDTKKALWQAAHRSNFFNGTNFISLMLRLVLQLHY